MINRTLKAAYHTISNRLYLTPSPLKLSVLQTHTGNCLKTPLQNSSKANQAFGFAHQLRHTSSCLSTASQQSAQAATSSAPTSAIMEASRSCYSSLRILLQGSQAIVQPASAGASAVETLIVDLNDGKVKVSMQAPAQGSSATDSLGLLGVCKLHQGKDRAGVGPSRRCLRNALATLPA